MKNKLRLGIDIDGVLASFDPNYQLALNRIGGTNIAPYIAREWHHEEAAGFSRAVIDQFWATEALEPEFWATAPVLSQPNVDMVKQMYADGHDIYYISTRPSHLRGTTEAWLFDKGLPVLVQRAVVLHSDHKGHMAKGLGLDAMWDDKPENLMDIGKISPKTRRFLIDQPWNQIYSPLIRPIPYTVERVGTIKQGYDRMVDKLYTSEV